MADAWNEDDSALYRRLVDTAVPRRREQIATLLTLLPLAPEREARLVEIGCGPGAFSHAVLEAFPNVRVLGLDGSESMLRDASERLGPFGERARLESFRLEDSAWLERLAGADAAVSSLCLHHLDGPDKRRTFGGIHQRLAPGGALLVADLVVPARAEAEALFRGSWDRYARSTDRETWKLFEKEQWNVYRYPDPADRPSGLFEQLGWLREAGFEVVDCFWMDAGHAIFGGYREGGGTGQARLDYAYALEIAERVISSR